MDAPDLAPDATVGNYQNPPAVPIRDELRYSSFQNLPIAYTVASVRYLLKPPISSRRVYLMLVNTHATSILYLNFGNTANVANSLPIQPNFGFVEYNMVVPQDDIYLIGNAAGTAILTYSNDNVSGVLANEG